MRIFGDEFDGLGTLVLLRFRPLLLLLCLVGFPLQPCLLVQHFLIVFQEVAVKSELFQRCDRGYLIHLVLRQKMRVTNELRVAVYSVNSTTRDVEMLDGAFGVKGAERV